MSIMPSTPRLRMPARSASSSPSAPYRSGVPYAIPDAMTTTRSELFMRIAPAPPRQSRGGAQGGTSRFPGAPLPAARASSRGRLRRRRLGRAPAEANAVADEQLTAERREQDQA